MKQSLTIGKEPNFSKVVLISAVFHLIFISLVVIPLKARERDFRSYYRVTLVGPLQTPRIEKAPLTEEKESKTTVKEGIKRTYPKADIKLEKIEEIKNVANEIERIRAISELKKREKTDKKTQEIQVGRGMSPDRAVPGSGRGVGKAVDLYYSMITQKVWEQWTYPDLKASGLEVIILIKIDKHGRIVFQEVEKSSGDLLFDRSAIKALSKASPLPPPPQEMEIGVRFYL